MLLQQIALCAHSNTHIAVIGFIVNADTISHLLINIFVLCDIIFAEICHTKSKQFDFLGYVATENSAASCCTDFLPESADITNDILKMFCSIIPLRGYLTVILQTRVVYELIANEVLCRFCYLLYTTRLSRITVLLYRQQLLPKNFPVQLYIF